MTQGIQTFKKYVMMLVLVLTGTMAANAADVIDLGVLKTGKGYSIDSKGLYKGSFTAPEEGVHSLFSLRTTTSFNRTMMRH